VDLKDPEESEVHVVQVVLKVSRETAVKMAHKDPSANEDLLEHKEALVSLDLKDHQVPQERMVCQDTPEAEEKPVSKVKLVLPVPLVLSVHKVPLVRMVHLENVVILVLLVHLARLAFPVPLEKKVLRVTEVQPVFPERSDLQEPKVFLVIEEHRDQWVLLV